jgi:hypothetical protein
MIHYRSRLILFAGICALPTLQAAAAELPQDLIDCRQMTSAVVRLDCYDQTIDAHKKSASSQVSAAEPARHSEPAAAALATTATTTATMATTATTQASADISPEALFGKNLLEMQESVTKATNTSEIDEITSFVSEVRSSASGKAIITLDNGQVWAQTDNSRLRLSGYDKVIIRRASLGSYLLFKSGSKTSMRVQRIS